ncbi:FAD-binding oxidoreductase [Winogradskyella sp. DF17]|uniref:FAD-binding oxidoreductase n=1 Tax=Winogradskyella pelagia TaxID=2819984 RepID=A0ABS3SXS2_9FLAO|nr:FAD-dependent oxidoreductase [Winogradskyella sp. DF17]MBO3115296.1 FAD-binding oxidoreductase [Winogradskyella sp. DF17]
MNLSYWEIKTWLSQLDFTIIGSGIVGLNTALHLKKRFPKSKILVLEKGMLPQGASTKNAGFACFGSLSEIISDLQTHSEEDVFKLIQNRIRGLNLLRDTLGDNIIDYNGFGGYELFLENDIELFERCLAHQSKVNALLKPLFKADIFSMQTNDLGFKGIQPKLCFNKYEGQLDTGKMMEALLQKAYKLDIKVLNNCHVQTFSENSRSVEVVTEDFNFSTEQLLIATNGFASQLISQPIKPARAQVLITKPIKDLHIKGTFHLDQGYYYFRNIDDRILFGGGRNLDFETEETTEFGLTERIQNQLKELLNKVILPNTDFEVDHSWSGIMGIGKQKKPIVKSLSGRVHCGVRLGGMGVAIGSLVGKELSELL